MCLFTKCWWDFVRPFWTKAMRRGNCLTGRPVSSIHSAACLDKRRIFGRSWLRHLSDELATIVQRGLSPLECIDDSLTRLGVHNADQADFVQSTLLALRGWGGMIWQTEVRPDRVHRPSPAGTLTEFLAIRLILDRLALQHVCARRAELARGAYNLREVLEKRVVHKPVVNPEQQAFLIFQLAAD